MEHVNYLKSLKALLKTKGVTYLDLARQLQMSESGVKKMLNSKDLSFRRFFQICEILNVRPGQVLTAAEQKEIPTRELSAKQQELLLTDRNLLAVYWRMTVENLSLEETRKVQKLSLAELQKILRRLVSADLIQERDGQHQSHQSGKFRWPDDSKIARHLNQEWSKLTLQRALRQNSKYDRHHRLMALKLSRKAQEVFLAKLSELLDETVRVAEREEMSLSSQDLKRMSILTAVVGKGVLDPEDQES